MEKLLEAERLQKTLLNNALRFCQADAYVQLARRQWKELHELPPEHRVCCLPIGNRSEAAFREASPKKKWCKHCRRIASGAINYYDALWERRAAKIGMKRAFKFLQTKLKQASDTRDVSEQV